MLNSKYYIINAITLYRIITAPLLLVLILTGQESVFKWLLVCSFFTDAIDGYLARRFNIVSRWGARLDSIGDDLTVFVAIVGLFLLKHDFVREQFVLIMVMIGLYVIQTIMAIIRYGKLTSFHTYSAKVAAVLQGVFLISVFFTTIPSAELFHLGAFFTIVNLLEEIILVQLLPKWQTDVKGLYWVLKSRKIKQL